MIYVMCGMYGNEEKYKEMLEKLNLNDEEDSLFVLGNVIGFGKGGMNILCDMMYRPNIFPVLGLQEYYAKKIFPQILNVQSVDECLDAIEDDSKEMFGKWIKQGGFSAVEAFLKLSVEERESVIDYLFEFAAYDELEAGGRKFVLAGSGIRNFEEGKEPEDFDEEDFVLQAADYSKVYFPDKFLITAAVSTENISGGTPGKVFSAKRHLALNCGIKNGGRLSAVCLDTMKVYYC